MNLPIKKLEIDAIESEEYQCQDKMITCLADLQDMKGNTLIILSIFLSRQYLQFF